MPEEKSSERIPPKNLTRRAIKSHLRERLRTATELSERDPLTGLPNQRAYEKRKTEEIERVRRTGRKATIMYLDLDKFKEINDLLGHAGGDHQLIRAAQALRQGVRATDFVARAGEKGDEFKIIFPETDIRQVRAIWEERLRPATQEMGIDLSAGAAELNPDKPDETERFADLALYGAKNEPRKNGNTLMIKEPQPHG